VEQVQYQPQVQYQTQAQYQPQVQYQPQAQAYQQVEVIHRQPMDEYIEVPAEVYQPPMQTVQVQRPSLMRSDYVVATAQPTVRVPTATYRMQMVDQPLYPDVSLA
jgi:hypothetical protein